MSTLDKNIRGTLDEAGNAEYNLLSVEETDIGGKDYIKTGQFDPRFSLSPHSTRSLSDGSGSYNADPGWIYHRVTWDIELPQANSAVYVTWDAANAGSGETLDVRLYNDTDGETIVEKTGADGSTSMGPVTYTPPTTASPIRIQLEVRSSPGTNSSTVFNPNVVFGVQL